MVVDRSLGSRLFDIFLYAFMGLAIFIFVAPFLYMFSLATSGMSAIINNRVTILPVDFNFNAFSKVFDYPGFFNAYKNTIFYTTAGTFISLSVLLLFAYPLSKSYLTGRKFIFGLIIFSMFFNGGLVPNFLLISTLRLKGTVWGILIPFAINQFNLIIMINFLRALPAEIEEAAMIDGMGYFGILTRIVVPLAKPAIATIGLYTAVFFWNDWFNALLYLSSKQYPVMMILRNIVVSAANAGDATGYGDRNVAEMSSKAAVILVSVLPIIALYPFMQRFFVKGLTVGSIKG
jgi:putative aldouronate transport system permease protein